MNRRELVSWLGLLAMVMAVVETGYGLARGDDFVAFAGVCWASWAWAAHRWMAKANARDPQGSPIQ